MAHPSIPRPKGWRWPPTTRLRRRKKTRSSKSAQNWILAAARSISKARYSRIEKTNARTNDPINSACRSSTANNAREGLRLSVAGRVLPGWNVFAGYTFLDAKILKSNDTQVVEGVTIPLQGKVPQNVPKYSANFWTTYDFLEKWQIGGGPTYVGSRYANNANM